MNAPGNIDRSVLVSNFFFFIYALRKVGEHLVIILIRNLLDGAEGTTRRGNRHPRGRTRVTGTSGRRRPTTSGASDIRLA